MKQKLKNLVMAYAGETGCEAVADEGSVLAKLNVEGLEIQLALEERTGMIIFQTGIGLFPERLTKPERADFFLSLLKDNNLFSGTRGFTLGIDEDAGLVTLQLAWDINNLEANNFANLMNNFIAVCGEWLVRLDNWRPGATSSEKVEGGESAFATPHDDFSGMLRV